MIELNRRKLKSPPTGGRIGKQSKRSLQGLVILGFCFYHRCCRVISDVKTELCAQYCALLSSVRMELHLA